MVADFEGRPPPLPFKPPPAYARKDFLEAGCGAKPSRSRGPPSRYITTLSIFMQHQVPRHSQEAMTWRQFR